MSDFIEIAGQTLKDMSQLANQAAEVSKTIQALSESARATTELLYQDEVKYNTRADHFSQRLTTLESELERAGEQAAARMNAQIAEVQRQQAGLQAKQALLRQHLNDLRGQATGLTAQVVSIQEKTEKSLDSLREQSSVLLAKSAERLDALEASLRDTTAKKIKAVEDAVEARRQDFKTRVDTILNPRIEADVKQFSLRINALTQKLSQLVATMAKNHHDSVGRRLLEMNYTSGTNWYGGGNSAGDCTATPRVTEMKRLGEQKGAEVERAANGTLGAANLFADTVRNTVVPLYKAVYKIPEDIKKVCDKVTH